MSNEYLSAQQLLTVTDIQALKQRGEKISCLTCYDASFAQVLDQAGIEILLVGDSLGMVVQGQASTVPVQLDEMVYHCACVSRARRRALVVADMPFASYVSTFQAVQTAARLMQGGGAQMVKLEGAKLDIIEALVAEGIAVCGHVGLLPQSIHLLGRYAVQGRQPQQAQRIIDQAVAIEQAGADLLVLECVPVALAREISQRLAIPVIGIGAGVDCDGQVLVLYDMLDIGIAHRPRFSKNFMAEHTSIAAAVSAYHQAVKSAEFPSPDHSY